MGRLVLGVVMVALGIGLYLAQPPRWPEGPVRAVGGEKAASRCALSRLAEAGLAMRQQLAVPLPGQPAALREQAIGGAKNDAHRFP